MIYANCIDELIKTISHPVLVIDENDKVIFHNGFERLTCSGDGKKPKENNIFDLFSCEEKNLLHNACETAIDSKKAIAHSICFTKNGGKVYAKAKVIPLFNPDTNGWYKICIVNEKTTMRIKKPAAGSAFENSSHSCKANLSDTGSAVEEAKKALHFLLKEGAGQLIKLREETLKDLANQFLPLLEGLNRTKLDETQLHYAKMLEVSIRNLTDHFTRSISDPMFRLSPMEIKIVSMIRAGKSNKEIAEIFQLSKCTVLTHRHHIRAKLGLKNKKQNLRSFLSSLNSQLKGGELSNPEIKQLNERGTQSQEYDSNLNNDRSQVKAEISSSDSRL